MINTVINVDNENKVLTGVGVVSAHEKGFGFIRDEAGESQFVPPPLMKQFIPGDKVSYVAMADARSGKTAVSGMTLIERQESYWLGEIRNNFHGKPEFKADEPIHVKLTLPPNHGIEPGVVFQVHVGAGGQSSTSIPVKIVHTIGLRTKRGFDMDYASAKWRLPTVWPEAVSAEAEEIAKLIPELEHGEVDLTGLQFVTIDGEGTRDFDDAIFASHDNGVTYLKVAIADVSRYVKIGSNLDKEAQRRGTSVYFPERVVPMLPESLSNGLCSLNPGVLRHALVCSLTINAVGDVIERSFERALIKSHARLTYSEVTSYVDEDGPMPSDVAPIIDAIKMFYDVQKPSRLLRGLLESRGREPKLRFDPGNTETPYSVKWEETSTADEMVEECMLAANCAAATHVANGSESHLYRYHQGVDVEKWEETRTWLLSIGIDAPESPSLDYLRKLLLDFREDVKFPLVEWRVRRSFAPAIYDELRPAHFTLGFAAYTHFTSPIRRYADLMVHRLILGEISKAGAQVAQECTELSRRAQSASRYPWDRMKRRALCHEKKRDYAARVAKTSKRGIKVIVDDWQTAVFVPEKNLVNSGFSWIEGSDTWVSPFTASQVQEGEVVKVRIGELTDKGAVCDLEGSLIT